MAWRAKTVLAGAAALAAAALVSAQELPEGHPPTGLPEGHPPIDPGAPAPQTPGRPEADPADVASLDAIVGAFYESISGPKGQPREWMRMLSLFKPKSNMVAARPTAGGGAGVWVLEVEHFIDINRNYFERGGYFEREVARRVERFGNIAHVWSTYEARQVEGSPQPFSRGIYSIQLLRDGERWWIVNMFWDFEREDAPIPERYLETVE